MRLQHPLVQQKGGSGFRGPDLDQPGLQGDLSLPIETQVEGARGEDLVIKINVPSCKKAPMQEAKESHGETKTKENEDPGHWSSIIKSLPQVCYRRCCLERVRRRRFSFHLRVLAVGGLWAARSCSKSRAQACCARRCEQRPSQCRGWWCS